MKKIIFFLFLISQSIAAKEECQKAIAAKRVAISSLAPFKVIESGQYFQIDPNVLAPLAKENYDTLTFYVEAAIDLKPIELYFTIQDDQSRNYWSQLNHISQIVPGRYKITIPINDPIGERGSSKTKRKLNRGKIKKAFIVIDPDQKSKSKIRVGQFSFESKPKLGLYKELKAFDFVDTPEHGANCFTQITAKSLYSKKLGFGFIDPVVWRTEDSQYADDLNRDVIYLKKGQFRVDLPNGKYQVQLNWNALGYWDPPFWSRRSLQANERMISLDVRDGPQGYLNDLLRFENIEPQKDEHPYELYLSVLMEPLSFEIDVTDRKIDFQFEGDDSGVALNWLLISPLAKKAQFESFQTDLKQVQLQEFEAISRLSRPEKAWIAKAPTLEVSEQIDRLTPYDELHTNKTLDSFSLVNGMQKLINLKFQAPQSGKLELAWVGQADSGVTVSFEKGIYQWVSLDRNHESYALMTHFLKPLKDNQDSIQAQLNCQYFVRLSSHGIKKSEHLKGQVQIQFTPESGDLQKWLIPIEIDLLAETLPRPDFPVGFLGLNALKWSYFPSPSSRQLRDKWDQKALEFLAKRHFTSFSGLPGSPYPEGGIEFDKVDAFLGRARKLGFVAPFFTYGGEFLHQFFENSNEEQRKQNKQKISQYLSQSKWQDVVFQFSDEPSGYSDNVDRDLKRGKYLKAEFSQLKLGGFTHFNPKRTDLMALNSLFDVASYSNSSGPSGSQIKGDWGLYNQAQGALENPRSYFGVELWKAREQGLSHYLEWHMSALNNYPYYDLDGREADVAMAYPTSSGELLPSIKFEQASAGLEDFLLIQLMSNKKLNKFSSDHLPQDPKLLRKELFKALK